MDVLNILKITNASQYMKAMSLTVYFFICPLNCISIMYKRLYPVEFSVSSKEIVLLNMENELCSINCIGDLVWAICAC